MAPCQGTTVLFCSFQQFPQSQSLQWLFELTQCPSRALNLAHALLLELQRYKDTLRCATRVRRSQDTAKNYWRKSGVHVGKKLTFVTLILDCKEVDRIKLGYWPDLGHTAPRPPLQIPSPRDGDTSFKRSSSIVAWCPTAGCAQSGRTTPQTPCWI